MTAKTEDDQSRVSRIKENHPWAKDADIRASLIYAYKRALADPTVGGDYNSIQIYLENFTDWLSRADENTLKNEFARASEWFLDDYRELMEDD